MLFWRCPELLFFLRCPEIKFVGGVQSLRLFVLAMSSVSVVVCLEVSRISVLVLGRFQSYTVGAEVSRVTCFWCVQS